MAEIENLLLEHLKRFQATLERIERDVRELKVGQTELRAEVLGVRRDRVNDAEVSAHVQVQLDAVKDRIDRLERRAELSD